MADSARIVVAAAAAAECRSVMVGFGVEPRLVSPGQTIAIAEQVSLLCTGVGPGPAGAAAGFALAGMDKSQPIRVLSLGVAGAYEGSGAGMLDTVLGTSSVFADHGLALESEFRSLDQMGFPPEPENWQTPCPRLLNALGPLATVQGRIATVAACSGHAERASQVCERSGTVAEAMEGASVALACAQQGVAFAELRVISNLVGDREAHPWRLDEALVKLAELAPLAAGRVLVV